MSSKQSVQSNIRSDHKQFRKANEIISPRVARGGTLSLLGRKIFNVLLYHMQQQGSPGVGCPEGPEIYQSLYWLPLSELAKDAAFNSEDTGLLKETLLKLQDIKIITDDSKGFSSDVLIASVKIIPGRAGQKTMLGWGIHAATEAILRNPAFYTRLSIYYLTRLRSTSGIALYENCKRYVSNPSKLSRREKWEWWHDVLTGQPINQTKPEYKYFKRDVLKTAIAEVNTTDIRVELLEHKNGRRVEELQFKIETAVVETEQPLPVPLIDSVLLNKIIALGFTQTDAEDILASYDEKLISATLTLLSSRDKDKNLPPIASKAAFFRSALRMRFAEQTTPPKLPAAPAISQTNSTEEKDETANLARRNALKQYDALSESEQQNVLAKFIEQQPVFSQYAQKSPNGRIIRSALAEWLLQNTLDQNL